MPPHPSPGKTLHSPQDSSTVNTCKIIHVFSRHIKEESGLQGFVSHWSNGSFHPGPKSSRFSQVTRQVTSLRKTSRWPIKKSCRASLTPGDPSPGAAAGNSQLLSCFRSRAGWVGNSQEGKRTGAETVFSCDWTLHFSHCVLLMWWTTPGWFKRLRNLS